MNGIVSIDELITKARAAATPEELQALASEEGIGLSIEESSDVYARLNRREAELSDCELDDVSGGGCASSSTGAEGRYCSSCGKQAVREVVLGSRRIWRCEACGGTW